MVDVHTGAEFDLPHVRGRRRLGFEVKRTSSPGVTPAMRSAIDVLVLERLDVIWPGDEVFRLAPKVRAVGVAKLEEAAVGVDCEVLHDRMDDVIVLAMVDAGDEWQVITTWHDGESAARSGHAQPPTLGEERVGDPRPS